jgi:excisionase family DNA binding protein
MKEQRGGDDVIAEGWITTAEASRVSGYRRVHVRRLAHEGKVRAQRIGRLWLVHKGDLLEYKANVRPGRPRKTNGGEG